MLEKLFDNFESWHEQYNFSFNFIASEVDLKNKTSNHSPKILFMLFDNLDTLTPFYLFKL